MDDRIILASPLGPLRIEGRPDAVTAIRFLDRPERGPATSNGAVGAAAEQLAAYFAGRLRRFDVPLDPGGTPFQAEVWTALAAIPFGVVWTYAQLATRVGRPAATRAVGAANGANPIPVLLPCHRVIGSDGSLTGYGGGIERKRALLELEGVRRVGPRAAIVPLQRSLF